MLLVEISPPGMERYTLILLAASYSGIESNVFVALFARMVSFHNRHIRTTAYSERQLQPREGPSICS
jgi:hypothetical protein